MNLCLFGPMHVVWKLLIFFIFGIFHQFLSNFKSDLSGNAVRPQASGFQKLTKIAFLTFLINYCPLKMNVTFSAIIKLRVYGN